MKFKSDIDIDFPNRDLALRVLNVVPASMSRDGKLVQHNSGVYPTDIPIDPYTGRASIDYVTAEDYGYTKLDFLNVSLYNQIRDEAHLVEMMNTDPSWDKLYDQNFCNKLIHIGNHYDTLIKMPEVVDSIPRMAMFLAIIRPAKRHLIGRKWADVSKTIWERPQDDNYFFKRSHSVAYSHLVVVHMNLLTEQERYSM